jgi:hypothetical protein
VNDHHDPGHPEASSNAVPQWLAVRRSGPRLVNGIGGIALLKRTIQVGFRWPGSGRRWTLTTS